MNDWNVRNVSEMSGMTGISGKTGMSGKTGKTGMSVVTGVPLEGLLAGMPGMSLEGLCKTHGWISRRSPCLLCVEFLFWNVVAVLKELFVLCM